MKLLSTYAFWKHMFSIKSLLSNFLKCIGTIWLAIEIINFFNPSLAKSINNVIDIWMLLAFSFIFAIVISRPKRLHSFALTGRDTKIEIYIGDFFDDNQGAFIISSNTSFDTSISDQIISKKSIQGQFTQRYYGTAVNHLDLDLNQSLKFIKPISTNNNKKGKSKIYELGTTVSININERKAYFVALASLNNNGCASSKKEDILISISKLWNYIMENGEIDPLIIPIVGTGYSRIPDSRDIMVKEIIKSFVAACSTRRFTERLRIVISPHDMKKHDMNISDLLKFLEYTCKYTQFDEGNNVLSISQEIESIIPVPDVDSQ